jgi:glycolate dehydrogenase FAD-binding subunit
MSDFAEDTAVAVERTLGRGRVRFPHYESRAAEIIAEPETLGEVIELVRKCERDGIGLAPLGAARTLAQLRAQPVAIGISLARLNRIAAYEPGDMTITVEAGLTLDALNAHTLPHRQRLAIDPSRPELTTIGALIAGAPSGPLRLSEGTVRDHLIGIRFIGHQARMIHGGGSVVKNVAGYDLMKVMTGSFGTLGIITEATFRLRPIPSNYAAICAPYETCTEAFTAAMRLRDTLPLVHLEVLSSAGARALEKEAKFLLVAGIAGGDAEIVYLREQIALVVKASWFISDASANSLYEHLRDFPDDPDTDAVIAEIAALPSELPRVLENCACEFRAHAGSGVAQLFETPPVQNGSPGSATAAATVKRWREAVHAAHGILRVLKVPAADRAQIAIFDEPPAPALKLMRRLKAAFDPRGIFNPGAFVGGL